MGRASPGAAIDLNRTPLAFSTQRWRLPHSIRIRINGSSARPSSARPPSKPILGWLSSARPLFDTYTYYIVKRTPLGGPTMRFNLVAAVAIIS